MRRIETVLDNGDKKNFVPSNLDCSEFEEFMQFCQACLRGLPVQSESGRRKSGCTEPEARPQRVKCRWTASGPDTDLHGFVKMFFLTDENCDIMPICVDCATPILLP